jgi:hypothetical protein
MKDRYQLRALLGNDAKLARFHTDQRYFIRKLVKHFETYLKDRDESL